MALYTLTIPPDQSSYTVIDGLETLSVKLDGGASKYRRDVLNATSFVTVQWSLNPDDYKYIRAFYNTATASGSVPFLIDLLLDFPELTQHQAYFIPGTMKLQSQAGLQYVVVAQLEVKPIPANEEDDLVLIMNKELDYLYGNDSEEILNLLDELVNVDLPEGLGQ